MASNSKLTREQKADRKAMMAALPAGSQMAVMDDTTVLLVPDGAVKVLATSVASSEEQKFRRKVGEYHALNRYFEGVAVPVPGVMDISDLEGAFGYIRQELDEKADDWKQLLREF